MRNFLRDLFIEHQPTEEDAYRKAEQVGFSVERTEGGYTVEGLNMDDQPTTWQFQPGEVADMNYMLDHVNSVALGEQYRLNKWGDKWEDPTGEKKQEIREYRTTTYYNEEYKPGWKRLFK